MLQGMLQASADDSSQTSFCQAITQNADLLLGLLHCTAEIVTFAFHSGMRIFDMLDALDGNGRGMAAGSALTAAGRTGAGARL